MAFADVFLLLTVLFVGLAALALMMKRPAQAAGARRALSRHSADRFIHSRRDWARFPRGKKRVVRSCP